MHQEIHKHHRTFLWTKPDFSAFRDSISFSNLDCVSLYAMSWEVMDTFSCRISSSLGSSSARFALEDPFKEG